MPDYGLIEGIGKGLSAGVEAYQKSKKYSDDMALKQEDSARKNIHEQYLMNKANGKQGKGGKIDAMVKLAQSGLSGDWDGETLTGIHDDPSLPHKGLGKAGLPYDQQQGLIHTKGDEAVRLQQEKNKHPTSGKNYDREAELLGLKGKTAEEVARIRAGASTYGKDLPEDRDRRAGIIAGSREKVAGINADSRGVIAGKNNQSRETIAGMNVDSRGEIAGLNNATREKIADQNMETRGLVARDNNKTKESIADSNNFTKSQIAEENNAQKGIIADQGNETKKYAVDNKPKPYGGEQGWRDKKIAADMISKGWKLDGKGGWIIDPEAMKVLHPAKVVNPRAPGVKPGRPAPISPYKKQKGTGLAKAVTEWRTQHRAQLDANASKLEDAIGLLSGGEATTGGYKGLVPDIGLKIFSPNTKIAQDAVHSAVVESLRPTLGAQFTEKEGTSIKQLEFDKGLSTQENLRRAQNLLNKIRIKIKMNDALAEYVDAHDGDDSGFPYQNYLGGGGAGGSYQHPQKTAPQKAGGGRPRIEYNRKLNKSRLTYPDGRVEMVDGQAK